MVEPEPIIDPALIRLSPAVAVVWPLASWTSPPSTDPWAMVEPDPMTDPAFNKRHKKYLEIREEAQEQHEKAMEMRDKVMAVKNERRKRYQEAKALIKEQNKKAKTEIFDDGKLEKVADKSLESLKKGSKISF